MGTSRRHSSRAPAAARTEPKNLARWRTTTRLDALKSIVRRTAGLSWDRALLSLLLEELQIDDLFDSLIGKPHRLRKARYPQAIAMAIALRHSWRPDDLDEIANRLGIGDVGGDTTAERTRPAPTKKSRPAKSRRH
jgi:hypothetical protein